MISIHDATLHQEVEWSYLLKSIRANLYASNYRRSPRSGLYQPYKIAGTLKWLNKEEISGLIQIFIV
jgi:hypothetical protein